ncbi:hypothetical protein [Oleidesulfovibrio sp.]|uniref:hypothetical protein n=1 Tax=Oleidesulfovibrio sp. TaxID=2909707 RepID=UPI003A8354D3
MKFALFASGGSNDQIDDQIMVQRMLDAQGHRQSRSLVLEDGAIGSAGVSAAGKDVHVFRHPSGNSFAVVCGVTLGSGVAALKAPSDDVLADEERIRNWLTALDGVFCAVWHDRRSGVWLVASDPHGMYPLYIDAKGESLCVASEIRAVALAAPSCRAVNPAGFGALMAMGHMVGNQTMLQGIERVEAATVIRWTAGSGCQSSSPYWALPEADTTVGVAQTADLLAGVLDAEAKVLSASFPEAQVLLSGGYDSRLLVAAVTRQGRRPHAILVQQPEDAAGADKRIARRVARQYRLSRTEWGMPDDFFSTREYLDYVLASGVSTRSLYLFISGVRRVVPVGGQGIWEGLFAGNLLGAGAVSFDFGELLRRRCMTQDGVMWRAGARLFSDAFFTAAMDGIYAAFSAHVDKYGTGAEASCRFNVLERMRNRTGVNPYTAYSDMNICLSLGSSREYWEHTFRLSALLKGDQRLYNTLIERHYPEMNKNPYLSGGKLSNLGTFDTQHVWNWLKCVLPWRVARSAGINFDWQRSRFLARAVELVDMLPDDVCRESVAELRRRGIQSPVDERMAELLLYRIALHCLAHESARPGHYGSAGSLLG